jgi:WD40-like Beta Propeller Repeat
MLSSQGDKLAFTAERPNGARRCGLERWIASRRELVAKPLAGGDPLTVVKFHEGATALPLYFRLSSNGKWLAYTSAESGTHEVYIVPFPKGDGKWQVSS